MPTCPATLPALGLPMLFLAHASLSSALLPLAPVLAPPAALRPIAWGEPPKATALPLPVAPAGPRVRLARDAPSPPATPPRTRPAGLRLSWRKAPAAPPDPLVIPTGWFW